jgi:hypothetical protein
VQRDQCSENFCGWEYEIFTIFSSSSTYIMVCRGMGNT